MARHDPRVRYLCPSSAQHSASAGRGLSFQRAVYSLSSVAGPARPAAGDISSRRADSRSWRRLTMNEFDITGEVNIQTLPVSIVTLRPGVDGAPDRVVDSRPTGAHMQLLRIGGRPVPLEAF